jgi:RNA polymerase sigma-70 factor (TIGR02960 family)
MCERTTRPEPDLLERARGGDETAFEQLVSPHRREVLAHCYRMIGSVHDAEDALQETLLGAWRGLGSFEGRSSLRTWLFQIATNACLRTIRRRPRRILTPDLGPPRRPGNDLGDPVTEPIWLEPWPDDESFDRPDDDDPASRYLLRESVELAFVAALQHLPGTQRAVLVLREVLGFSAAETASILRTTAASVNSALQRARRTIGERMPETSQQAELAALGPDGQRALVDAFMSAWERADVPALLEVLTEDVRFTMPPLPAWFLGREDVGGFFARGVFSYEWRLFPIRANAQPGFVCYARERGAEHYRIGAMNVLNLREGRVSHIAGFLDPSIHRLFGFPAEPPENDLRADR